MADATDDVVEESYRIHCDAYDLNEKQMNYAYVLEIILFQNAYVLENNCIFAFVINNRIYV